jgi:hypothetical protein
VRKVLTSQEISFGLGFLVYEYIKVKAVSLEEHTLLSPLKNIFLGVFQHWNECPLPATTSTLAI